MFGSFSAQNVVLDNTIEVGIKWDLCTEQHTYSLLYMHIVLFCINALKLIYTRQARSELRCHFPQKIVKRNQLHPCDFVIAEKLILTDNFSDFPNQSMGKTEIDGVDDKEEMELTDVIMNE